MGPQDRSRAVDVPIITQKGLTLICVLPKVNLRWWYNIRYGVDDGKYTYSRCQFEQFR